MEKEKKTPTVKTDPNMLKVGTVYSITINPDDHHQYYGEQERFKKTHKYWVKRFQFYRWECLLYPEISSPHDSRTKPRIHYHGLISFRDTAQLLYWYETIHYDLARFAYFDIDTWDGKELYIKYAKKNTSVMKRFCKIYNLPYEFQSLEIKALMQKHVNAL